MKKQTLLAIAATTLLQVTALVSCGGNSSSFAPVAKEDIKIGLITLHDESSTYDKNFIDSMYRALDELGMKRSQLSLATGIEENADCKDKANEFAKDGCHIVFADSFGHEDHLIEAATANPNVRFAHATGTKAHTVNLKNFSNAFAAIYEGRYLAGVAAGMKLNEMKAAGQLKGSAPKIGYVGAFPYAEVKSGYTSFYLGAKSVCEDVTMDVRFTNAWFDITKENTAATALIQGGCDLISQHADSMGAPNACETAGVPNVTYNGSTAAACPNTYLVSSKIDWTPYYKHLIQCVIDGKEVEKDWTGTIANGAVKLDAVGTCAAAGTQAKIDEVKEKLANGTLKVFDTSKFTVTGDNLAEANKYGVRVATDASGHVTSCKADVDFDTDYAPDTEAVKDGYFQESVYRSAPYFDLDVDGITILTK